MFFRTRILYIQNPRNILTIECTDQRPVDRIELPSWVVGFSKPQNLTSSLKLRKLRV